MLAPLLIAFGGNSFWMSEKHYHVQPDVTFRNDLVLLLEGTNSAGAGFGVMWTTSNAANDLLGDSARTPILRSRAEDDNRDGFADEIHLDVSMPLKSGEKVLRAALMAFVDFKLHKQGKLNMDAAVVIDVSNGLAGSGASVVGDLCLHQRSPLLVKGGYLAPYDGAPLFDAAAVSSVEDVLLPTLLNKHNERNFTAVFDAPAPVWHTDLAGAATSFDLKATVRMPPCLVYATPSVSEILKWGWVQYVAMLSFVWLFVRYFRDFLFQQRLVTASVVSDAHVKAHAH